MSAITFKGFNCYYKNKKDFDQVIFDLELSVKEGELLVIVGESGSGKTTLLKACMGMMNYFEGDLLINGVPVEDIKVEQANYAYVSQLIGIAPHMTVFENIAFPLRVMKASSAEIEERVEEVAGKLGIRFLLSRKPRQLSGGQQQRVAIARAIVKNPTFIFFDEPFSNIDPSMRLKLRIEVKRLVKECGCTAVFVTHDISEAFFLADRIAVLEHGRLAELGTPEEIEKAPRSELMRAYFEPSTNTQ